MKADRPSRTAHFVALGRAMANAGRVIPVNRELTGYPATLHNPLVLKPVDVVPHMVPASRRVEVVPHMVLVPEPVPRVAYMRVAIARL